jgi:Mrp family chromosome partitioning ATPase/uncharacterized protein involved in exopolysaccharide biosynthesis
MERDTLVRAAGAATRMRVRQTAIDTADDAAAENPLAVLRELLRGRYVWACVLAVVGAATGALVAHQTVPDRFESVGLIRIRPNVPRILYQSENNAVMPMFQSYVDAQASLIRSDAVIEQAMAHPDWQALGHEEVTAAATAAFAARLEVRHPKGSELIHVAFRDPDQNVPAVAVRATIDAYVKLFGERDARTAAQTLQILEDRRTALAADQAKLNEQMTAIARHYGSNALDPLVQYKAQELNGIRSELRRVKLGILAAESALAPAATTNTTATKPGEVPNELLAVHDPLMRGYFQQKAGIEREIAAAQLRVGENHPSMREYRTRLGTIIKDIEVYGDLLRRSALANRSGDGDLTPGAMAMDPAVTLERLRAQGRNLETFYEEARTEMAELGEKNIEMQSLRNAWDDVQRSLDEIRRRTEQLNVESAASGRVEVMDPGNRPVLPSGQRRGAWTGVGGAAGLVLGVGAVAFVGLLDRRRVLGMSDAAFRVSSPKSPGSPDRRRRFPILGAIPNLSPESASDAQVHFTTQAVHRIRARLQLQRGTGDGRSSASSVESGDCRVIAFTSPSAGDGKTSTTIALGLSFAASGSRTLLIEGDVVGGGLTGRLNARVCDDLARILHTHSLLTRERVDAARRLAKETNKPLEQVLRESGWASDVDLNRAKVIQRETRIGLLDALGGRPLDKCVAACLSPGLHVLPLGNAGADDVAKISPAAVRRLLKEAREKYDTVLIDTGPILGSLEAAVMTAAADGVVIMVSRGNQRSSLEAAVADLDSLGANLIGAIYNRAKDEEVGPASASFHSSRMFESRPYPAGAASPAGLDAAGDGSDDHAAAARPGSPKSAAGAARVIGPVAAAVAGAAQTPGTNGANGRH